MTGNCRSWIAERNKWKSLFSELIQKIGEDWGECDQNIEHLLSAREKEMIEKNNLRPYQNAYVLQGKIMKLIMSGQWID